MSLVIETKARNHDSQLEISLSNSMRLSIPRAHREISIPVAQSVVISSNKREFPVIGKKGDLYAQYLCQKSKPIYSLSSERVKVMKGSFLYDRTSDSYLVNPTNWWCSEKLDGIRAIWTGIELRTKQNNVIQAPQWFLDELPAKIALDGELYLGRGKFNDVQSIVMDKNPNHYEWRKVSYNVFDIPDSSNFTFEEVQELLQQMLPRSSFLKIIPQTKLIDLENLLVTQKQIVSEGGEGLMIRRPRTCYQVGVTQDLLKFKAQLDSGKLVNLYDDDAIIIGYKYNHDVLRPNGEPTMKSLIVRWFDQTKFPLKPEFSVSLQITKVEKRGDYSKLFPIGKKVKILYTQLFGTQKPRYPRYGGWVLD